MFNDYSFELLKDKVILLRGENNNRHIILGSLLPVLWDNSFLSITFEPEDELLTPMAVRYADNYNFK